MDEQMKARFEDGEAKEQKFSVHEFFMVHIIFLLFYYMVIFVRIYSFTIFMVGVNIILLLLPVLLKHFLSIH